MANVIPVKATFTSNTVTGLAEFQSGDTIDISTYLSSSSITFAGDSGSDSASLGETLTVAGGTSISTAVTSNTVTINLGTIDASSTTISNIPNSSLSNSSITFAGDSGSDSASLGETLTIAGTSNEIETTGTSNTVTIGLPSDVTIGNNLTVSNDLTVTGNLTINGTTTTVDTTNTTISDNLLELNSGVTSNANDTGILIERGSTGDNAIIAWDESADKFTLGTTTATASDTGNLTITTGTLVADLEGDVTGNLTGNVTGNADTATALATARNIAGQSFDGTANISIASTDLSDTASIALLTATQTLTNKTIDASNNTLSNIGNASLSNSSITVSDGSNTSPVSLGGTLTFTGSANEVEITESAGTVTIGLPSNVTISNNLTVSGATNVSASGITFNDGSTQTSAGASNAFAIAQAVALG